MERYVLGIDAGTESIRTGIYNEKGDCISFGCSENTNIHQHPGWCEQSVQQWTDSMVESIRLAFKDSPVRPEQIEGVGIDGTSCTVVHLDSEGKPLRDAIMWMDIRAAKEADDIAACGDGALKYVGHGKVSAEWFPCKNLWVKRHEPEIYAQASTIFEHTDWIAYWLTGEVTANICTVSIRWFYNQKEGGFPVSLYEKIGLGDIFDKLPKRVVNLGEVIGGVSAKVAALTGLREGIPVAGGGADAYMGVIGVNALKPGKLALITGSSQLHIGMTETELHAPGIFGTFPSAIVPGMEVVEAGQISTGSIIKWFVTNFLNADLKKEAEERGIHIYRLLDEKAAKVPPGSEGLVVLEHWQGNRTPWVDANSRGVIRGLTLKHTTGHLFRAIMEGVVYGTAIILKRMEEGGVYIDEIITCGGATKSDLWMQIHADVTGKRITIPVEQQAVSLGSAIAATVAAGIHPDLGNAAEKMVRIKKVIEPIAENHELYKEYVRQYESTYEHLKEDSKRLVQTLES
ncbi:MAG: FGGY family carbohydrate kinase [Sphaerochaetaceae bacterium]|jgi:ribulokinase|nr:FGGY family carbohydrate kinase [Sphaerochaetaceae bacterium]MDX9938423.1 FGGY family carbohydrate kinase [Sphaerochaetaceae bacterium]